MTLAQLDDSSDECFHSRQFNYLCRCNGGDRYYVGADTDAKRAILVWIPCLSGLASLIGSLLIIADVSRDKNKLSSVYHQLGLGLSIFDCLSSLSWILGTAPIPEYEYGEPTGIYGAVGNEATCVAQGFFFQLGLIGSVAYNAVLSFYYVLVIVKSCREWQLRPLRRWLHGIPVVLALGLAFAGLSFYHYLLFICHAQLAPNHTLVIVFVFSPVAVCLYAFNMVWMYWVQPRDGELRTLRVHTGYQRPHQQRCYGKNGILVNMEEYRCTEQLYGRHPFICSALF